MQQNLEDRRRQDEDTDHWLIIPADLVRAPQYGFHHLIRVFKDESSSVEAYVSPVMFETDQKAVEGIK